MLPVDATAWASFSERVCYQRLDFADPAGYDDLVVRLDDTVGLLLAVSLAMALRRRTGEFNMLASRIGLDEALASERSLYPAWPDRAAALEEWLRVRAEPLCAALPGLRATVQQLEARGRPQFEAAPARYLEP